MNSTLKYIYTYVYTYIYMYFELHTHTVIFTIMPSYHMMDNLGPHTNKKGM